MSNKFTNNVNPVPIPLTIPQWLEQNPLPESPDCTTATSCMTAPEIYKDSKKLVNFDQYYYTSLAALGIITKDHANNLNQNPTSQTGTPNPNRQRLTPLQLAQASMAQATGQIMTPGLVELSPEGQHGHKMLLVSAALDELHKAGPPANLADMFPWMKPPPTNDEVADMLKKDFPDLAQKVDGVKNRAQESRSLGSANDPGIQQKIDLAQNFSSARDAVIATSSPEPAIQRGFDTQQRSTPAQPQALV